MPNQPDLPLNAVIKSGDPTSRLIDPHRVLCLDESSNSALLFRMSQPYKRPRRFILDQLVDDWVAKKICLQDHQLPSIMLLPDDELRSDYKKIRDRWWGKYEPLLGVKNVWLLYEDFSTAIKEFAKKAKINPQNVYVHVYRFFYYGCMPNAFLPRFDLRGGPGKARILGTRKIGRPPDAVRLGHNLESVGLNVTDEDKEKFAKSLERHWASGEHYSLAKTYIELCKESYTDVDGNNVNLQKDTPNYRQFVYHAKLLPQYPALARRRIGITKFDREYRAVIGRSSAEVIGPTQRYQIDATIADVYLTSMYSRSWIIGRPVVYFIVDVFSGKIVGIYVGLEGPSWEGARLALLNAFLPKDEYIKRYGLEGEGFVWICHNIPVAIMADRAELLSENAKGLVSGLNIAIDVAPGYRPDFKGIVERMFGTFNETIHFMPGAVVKRMRERGDRNNALDGTYNLYEFTRIIIRHAIHFNAHHTYEDRLTPGMISKGIKATPNALWDFGMEHLVGGTPYRTKDEIYAHLLPHGKATVREDGIYFEGLLYTSPIAMQQRWFERARRDKRFSVPIRYNKEIPSRIWVLSDVESELRLQIHEATLIDHFDRYANLQFDEIQDVRKYEDLVRNDDKHGTLESQIRTELRDEKDLKHAQEECRKVESLKSSAQRTKDIRPQRAREKQKMREKQAEYESQKFGRNRAAPVAGEVGNVKRSMQAARTDALIMSMLDSDEDQT